MASRSSEVNFTKNYTLLFSFICINHLAVQLSGNVLVSTKVFTLRWARLVPGWVTVFKRVNYLGMQPATRGHSVAQLRHIYLQWPRFYPELHNPLNLLYTKLNGALSRLHSADEDAVSWLTNYGS